MNKFFYVGFAGIFGLTEYFLILGGADCVKYFAQ